MRRVHDQVFESISHLFLVPRPFSVAFAEAFSLPLPLRLMWGEAQVELAARFWVSEEIS